MTEQPPWVTYDSRADALTIVLSEEAVARTVEEPDGRLVDLSAKGEPVAIEVLGVSAGFALDDLADKYELVDAIAAARPSLPQQFYRQYA